MVRVKLQTFSRSVLAFQKLLFHPLNVNKGLDMTMVAPLFSTRYPCHATANPGSYDCHQVSTLCIKSGPVVVGVGRKDGLGSTLGAIIFHLATAWNHSLQFGSVWWFAQTFLGEIKWARVLQDTQHHVRCRLWPPASASWTSEVRDMPARMQRRRKHTTLFLERHQMMCCLDVNTEVLDVNTGDVLSVFTPSFVHRWRAISGILARPAVHFKQPAITSLYMYAVVMYLSTDLAANSPMITFSSTSHAPSRRCYRRRMCTFSALHSLTLQKRKRIKSHNSTSTKSQGFQVHLDNPEIDDVWCDSFCSSWCSHLLPQCVFTSYIYSECKMHFMSTSSCNKLSPHRLRQCSFPRHSLSSIKRYFGRLRIGCFAPLLGDNSIED